MFKSMIGCLLISLFSFTSYASPQVYLFMGEALSKHTGA